MEITGAQAIVKSLLAENVDTVFGYPGAAICPFYDALLDSGIKHILTRHEQGAAHAASGYARVTGKAGVCVSTSGPGATNLITGIATAYMDSIPLVAITGQVSTELIGRDVFQEVDITGATLPFCKHSYLVKDANLIPRIVKEAFYIASTGRPGPVLLDVPVDIQNAKVKYNYPEHIDIRGYKPTLKGHINQIKKAAEAFMQARRPVIVAGGGVITANAHWELQKLAETCDIPVATTLMGIGSMVSTHPLNLGMVGTHGSYIANYAVNHADLLVILGARVGDRAMGAAHNIAKRAKIIHIDVDPAEIGKNIGTSIPIVGDAKNILSAMVETVEPKSNKEWRDKLEQLKAERGPKYTMQEVSEYVQPKYLLEELSNVLDEKTVVTTEVGQNQIWAANFLKVKYPRTFITSGGLGTMGYGLPAAVGVSIGRPDACVINISGDGSFQMSMQELGTIRQHDLNVKIVLFNNYRLGMVRELQKQKYRGRYYQVELDKNPDFVQLAEAYGFAAERITSNHEVREALKRMRDHIGPYLLECRVHPEESTL